MQSTSSLYVYVYMYTCLCGYVCHIHNTHTHTHTNTHTHTHTHDASAVCLVKQPPIFPHIFSKIRKLFLLPSYMKRRESEWRFIFSRIKKRRKPKVKLVTLLLCEVKKSRYSFYEKVPTCVA
jgi:hypothetical protein